MSDEKKPNLVLAIALGVVLAVALGAGAGWGLKWAFGAFKWPAQSKTLGMVFGLGVIPFVVIRYYVYGMKMRGCFGSVCPTCGSTFTGKFCGQCGSGN
jgi:hypothetical protein